MRFVVITLIRERFLFWCLQDEGLDIISEGLDTLKNLAHDMNEVGYESCFTSNSI